MNVRETWYRPIGSLDFHGIQWSTMVHFPRGRGGSIAANRVGGHDVRLARGGEKLAVDGECNRQTSTLVFPYLLLRKQSR